MAGRPLGAGPLAGPALRPRRHRDLGVGRGGAGVDRPAVHHDRPAAGRPRDARHRRLRGGPPRPAGQRRSTTALIRSSVARMPSRLVRRRARPPRVQYTRFTSVAGIAKNSVTSVPSAACSSRYPQVLARCAEPGDAEGELPARLGRGHRAGRPVHRPAPVAPHVAAEARAPRPRPSSHCASNVSGLNSPIRVTSLTRSQPGQAEPPCVRSRSLSRDEHTATPLYRLAVYRVTL